MANDKLAALDVMTGDGMTYVEYASNEFALCRRTGRPFPKWCMTELWGSKDNYGPGMQFVRAWFFDERRAKQSWPDSIPLADGEQYSVNAGPPAYQLAGLDPVSQSKTPAFKLAK